MGRCPRRARDQPELPGVPDRAARDQELDLLAGWLAHPDQRLRLNEVDLARQLVLRMLGSAGSRPRSPEGSDARLDEALLRLAGAALRKAARLGPVQQEH